MGKFLIYYLPGRSRISILRVLHGKRLQIRTFKKQPATEPVRRKPH
jgi:plasmid stabilization system protein ParE